MPARGGAQEDPATGTRVPYGEGPTGQRDGQMGRQRKRHHRPVETDVYDNDGNDRLHQVLMSQNDNIDEVWGFLVCLLLSMVAGCLRGLTIGFWTTDHYHPCSNLGVGISEG